MQTAVAMRVNASFAAGATDAVRVRGLFYSCTRSGTEGAESIWLWWSQRSALPRVSCTQPSDFGTMLDSETSSGDPKGREFGETCATPFEVSFEDLAFATA